MTFEIEEQIPFVIPLEDNFFETRQESLLVSAALVKLRAKHLQEARSCLDEQEQLSKAMQELVTAIESTEAHDVMFLPLRTEIFQKVQLVFTLLKQLSLPGFDPRNFNKKAESFLKDGSCITLHELLVLFLKHYDQSHHKSALEGLARLKSAAFLCQEKEIPEIHSEEGISVTIPKSEEPLLPKESEQVLCDSRLIASLGKAVDHSDTVISALLDQLEFRNIDRSEIRLLIQKIEMLPHEISSLEPRYPEVAALAKKFQKKIAFKRFSWSCEEEKRTLSNELLQLLTESNYETKLIYSKMSQEVSRRSEYVKVFGHIINALLECEMKFLKNMRW